MCIAWDFYDRAAPLGNDTFSTMAMGLGHESEVEVHAAIPSSKKLQFHVGPGRGVIVCSDRQSNGQGFGLHSGEPCVHFEKCV